MSLLQAADEAGRILQDAVTKELLEQGHNASGNAINSLHYKVNQTSGILEISVWGLDYLINVNNGRRPGKYVPIDVLERWVKIKGIDARSGIEAKRLAFMISRAIYREGSPTQGSYQYSNNGRRKNFVEQVLKDTGKQVEQLIMKAFSEEFSLTLQGKKAA